jgi:L-threonylcarbamoyladenylate synthase
VIRLVPGGGIAAPSANRFGKVSPTTAAHVVEELGPYLDAARDLILDGGPCSVGLESTIVDCTTDPPMLLRPGAISADQLAETLSGRLERVARGPSRAPGMLAAHYAPNAVVEIVDEQTAIARVRHYAGARVALLAPTDLAIAGATRLDAPIPYTPEAIAPILYARLREADTLGFDVLLVVPPDQHGVGAAVLDRLTRAAVGSARAPR